MERSSLVLAAAILASLGLGKIVHNAMDSSPKKPGRRHAAEGNYASEHAFTIQKREVSFNDLELTFKYIYSAKIPGTFDGCITPVTPCNFSFEVPTS